MPSRAIQSHALPGRPLRICSDFSGYPRCHPVDLAKPDQAARRGQQLRRPPPNHATLAPVAWSGSPRGGRRDGAGRTHLVPPADRTADHPGDLPARRGRRVRTLDFDERRVGVARPTVSHCDEVGASLGRCSLSRRRVGVARPTVSHLATLCTVNALDEPKMRRYARLSTVFTPGAPVKSRDLFAGRVDQVLQITAALPQAGRHIVIYGERGVGKTSLANVLTEFLYPIGDDKVMEAVRLNCNTNDTFKSLWTKAFKAAKIEIPDGWTYGTPDPDEIRSLLEDLEDPLVLVFDEFDRVDDDEALSLLADTIKALSDHAVDTKIVIVGVGSSIDQLIGEHESVQRAIEEVSVQRMSEEDMSDIIRN